MARPPRSTVVGVVAATVTVLLASAGAALWWASSDDSAPARPPASPLPRWEPQTTNTWFDVAAPHEPEAEPIVFAYEEVRYEHPTFVLYRDGRYLRHPLRDLAEPYSAGQLDATATDALHRRVVEAGFEDIPPLIDCDPSDVDGNRVLFCASRSGRWLCAAVESGFRRLAQPQPMIDGRPISGAVPIPEPLQSASIAVHELETGGADSWRPNRYRLPVEPLDRREWAQRDNPPLPLARPWPATLPPLDPDGVELDAEGAAHVRGLLRGAQTTLPFELGANEFLVSPPRVEMPAEDLMDRVRLAFLRGVVGRPY